MIIALERTALMAGNRMRPVHPGKIIQEDVLTELGMSANAFAKAIGPEIERSVRPRAA
jgi:plasmid maintenance system antidote protein VapI